MTFSRRRFLKSLAGAGAVFVAGCKAAASTGSPRPAPWEPVDPAFTGCEGG